MSEDSKNNAFAETIARIINEPTPVMEFTGSSKGREPTLDEARDELAASISQIAHTLFSKQYGPLVGTVTKTTVASVLKSAEDNLYRVKGDATLVVTELVDRAFTSKKKSSKK